jgi:hypothetical protein
VVVAYTGLVDLLKGLGNRALDPPDLQVVGEASLLAVAIGIGDRVVETEALPREFVHKVGVIAKFGAYAGEGFAYSGDVLVLCGH